MFTKLRYETGTATLIQFAIVMLLGFINGLVSIISTCHAEKGDCVSNSLVSLILIILQAVWLIFICVVGYAAQDKRSPRIAQLLIALEGMNALVALFDARHYPNLLGLITSVIDFALAVWVIALAWRLTRARGGRIPTTSGRARRRPVKRAS